MSWDIYIQDLPDVPTSADIPQDFRPRPIGLRKDLHERLVALLPDAAVQDELWFFLRQPTVDLSVGIAVEGDQVSHIVIHVHGGDEAPGVVAHIVSGLGLRALDTGTGDFFDPAKPEAGYRTWRAFKDGLPTPKG